MRIKVLTKSDGRLSQLIFLIVVVFEAGHDFPELSIIDMFIISQTTTDALFHQGFCGLCQSQGVVIFFFFMIRLEISVSTMAVVALKQARDAKGMEAITPIPVKTEPRIPLLNTKLPTEQAPSKTDTILYSRL